MANVLTAINSFRPKLKLGKSVTITQLIEYIASRTGLNRGSIQLVLASWLTRSFSLTNKAKV